MDITTTVDGTSARIALRGDLDFDTLPPLRAAADALPAHVTDLLWDLSHTPFMDVTGLHLLFARTPLDGPDRRTTVTGLRRQPLRLLLMAADIHPAAFDLTRLFPDTPPTLPGRATPERP
ncbi:STAS domain-containing protein [Streptomyces sp. NPDC126499]|uniref:STAS domain-containing protein n=1 Tax=Streptomyces sp. NPDC126499 TaxID=3155314 RepID=UPI003329666D